MYILKEAKIEQWYHGTPHEITNWSNDFIGEGTDQEGPGIYFTSNYEDATGYMKGKGRVYTIELKTTKWLSTTIKPKWLELKKLIEWAEDYESLLQNWGNEDVNDNFKEAKDTYMTSNDTHFEACKSIWYDFYQYEPKGFASSMVALGYDGVIVKKSFMNTYHAIVWNPKIIKVME